MSLISIEGLENPLGFGPFNTGQRIALVFDSPILDDIKTNKPLNGTYGSVMTQCLGVAGITLSDCSVFYVLPNGNLSTYWSPKGGFSSKGVDHLVRLKEELLASNPTVIVPCGEVPLQAITQKKGITKWRNSILESSLCSGIKSIPTIDPKTAVMEYLYRYHISNDLKRISQESLTREIVVPIRSLRIQPTFEEARVYLQTILNWHKKIAFDIEVRNQEVSCIAIAISANDVMSIPFDTRWSMEEEMQLWLLIDKILGDSSISKILQNATFDIPFLTRKNKIITRGYVHDTMIKHHLNYPDFPKNLGFICSIYTREPFYKDEGKGAFKGPIADFDQYYRYNAKDAACTFEADDEIQKELIQFGNAETYGFCQRLMKVLFYMMHRGIKVDKEALEEHKVQAKKELKEYQEQLNEIAGFEFNVASPTQCKKYFYDIKGFKPITSQKKNPKTHVREAKVTTNNKAMKKLAIKGCKEAVLVQKIRGYRKLIGTYLNIEFDSDGRLRCSFNISGTSSGRLSSSETIFGTGTNMQNLPKVFKSFLVADEGQIFLEMDKAQAEWVVTAYCCGDANMIRTIENREDAHVNTGHLMFGAPKELIREEDELLGTESDEEKIRLIRTERLPEILRYSPVANMSIRQAGKKSNHGLNYDLGANGFAATYGMDIRDARRCYDLYHRAYPSLKVWHAAVRNQLGRDRTLVNLYGRKRRFLGRWCDDLFKAAYSYIPQSTVAQLLNLGLVTLYEDQEKLDFLRPLDILLQVHDSMLAQYPLDNLDGFTQAIKYAKEVFDKPLIANGRQFVIRTDAKVGFDAKNLFKISIEGTEDEIKQSLINATQQAIDYQNSKLKTIELEEEESDEETEEL